MVGLMASGSKNNFLLFMFFLRPKNVNRLPIREGHGVGKTQGQGTVGHRLPSVLSRLERGAISSNFVGRGRGRWIRETLLNMASLFLLPCSPICPRRLLNRSLLRTFLLPRSSIALENRSFSQCLTTASHFRWKVLGQTLRCSRFYAANAGIVQSIYTIDIPEQSLPEFVMNNFHEHGDDIAMVGLNESLKLS